MIDLWQTSDDSLLGEVGEIVAWKHLWTKGFLVWPFWRVAELRLFSDYLSRKQANYIYEYADRRLATYKRTFDLVGILRRNQQPYLIEVKTTRSERYRYNSRKFPDTDQRLEAKSLGFKLLLVVVRLVDNWKFAIASREL